MPLVRQRALFPRLLGRYEALASEKQLPRGLHEVAVGLDGGGRIRGRQCRASTCTGTNEAGLLRMRLPLGLRS